MIGKFEHIATKKTGFPRINQENISQIRTIFFTDTDFVFSSESNFENRTLWMNNIKSENIGVIRDVKTVNDETEQQQYITSELDYQYSGRHGKYIFVFRSIFEQTYYNYIASFSGLSLRVFFADVNNNIFANLNGSEVRGMDVELLHVEKRKIGGTDTNWTVIKLVLTDPDEFNLKTTMDWNPNRINLVHVDISSVTGSGNEISFIVQDSIFGIDIDNLFASFITISDDENTLTVSSLERTGCGSYKLTASGNYTTGTISIDSDYFYGSVSYIINETAITLSDLVFDTNIRFSISVSFTGSGDPVTGLTASNFTIVDDLTGSVSISSVSETSAGTYLFTTGDAMDDGVITCTYNTVQDTYEYQTVFQVLVLTPPDPLSEYTNKLVIRILDAYSNDPVTTVPVEKISVVDYQHGALTISIDSVDVDGYYTLILDKPRTSGYITVTAPTSTATTIINTVKTYSAPVVYFKNCGASNTTDFTNVTDGLANRVTSTTGSRITPQVTTFTGFTGNVQEIKKTATDSLQVNAAVLATYYKYNTQYRLKFKYQLSSTLETVTVQLLTDTGVQPLFDTFTFSGGFFNTYESDPFTVSEGVTLQLNFFFNDYNVALRFDEVELIEV